MTVKQRPTLYTCLISKIALLLSVYFSSLAYSKGHVVRTERHRDGQTRKAREKNNPSLGYKDLFLACPPTPKGSETGHGKTIKDTFARAIANSSILNFGRLPLKIQRSDARAT